jgi:hypothetical protein
MKFIVILSQIEPYVEEEHPLDSILRSSFRSTHGGSLPYFEGLSLSYYGPTF